MNHFSKIIQTDFPVREDDWLQYWVKAFYFEINCPGEEIWPECMCCKLFVTENVDIMNGLSVSSAPGNCNSKNCIYLCVCKLCQKPYFGRTIQWINKRMCGHQEGFYKVRDNEDIDETNDDYSLGLHLAHEHGGYVVCQQVRFQRIVFISNC